MGRLLFALMTLVLALVPVVGQASCPSSSAQEALTDFVESAYGKQVRFDVLRNGKRVGEHVTEFSHGPSALTAESRMELAITLLFVPVYNFSYQSKSRWCDGDLHALDAETRDGDDITRTRVRRDSERLLVSDGRTEQAADATLIPSDHWNRAVLEREEIFNTITGVINRITIGACQDPSPLVAAAARNARCYSYSGGLQAQVWYDDRQRWVGLEFDGRDGSKIIYVCRQCGHQQ